MTWIYHHFFVVIVKDFTLSDAEDVKHDIIFIFFKHASVHIKRIKRSCFHIVK